ncbi:MAG: hypothetical protein A3J27_09745 [Candidatus Tectomicrobia bacterium RIFCSPLOWO2_12_FULL_69_37]|nr:MAG: hypothetical protein A3I72_04320 [Candidatus Tectomicrobia bacterium RIFCSPLOWO2_02_FULL_70_19]OGL61740.1 MAG: hypothetical protein A3J27_09745 [Candidatus Tectomicrobia bacterium RIFCSPLOWO2_12_FULL_69_37]
MVIDKLDALEAALQKVLEELTELRRSRQELETELNRVQSASREAAGAAQAREEEAGKLREENARLLREHAEVKSRVERILHHLPVG